MSVEFTFPAFFSYPPYFTLQPNKESQAKQIELWKQLLLQYAKAKRKYKYYLKEDSCHPFHNPMIQRSLSLEGRQAVCSALVAEGKAEWVGKDQTVCLVTIQPVPLWASTIHDVVRTRFTTSIVTIEELHSGDEARGTELEGLPEELIHRALQVLEKQGHVSMFSTDKGTGVKFAR
eukprot:jgi/Ulvmu1/3854/UM018_0073.1